MSDARVLEAAECAATPTLARRAAYPARAIARAEAPLTAGTDQYMRRAARAVAGACLAELRELRGSVAGSRVLVLVGGGRNGGDALLAGALLARRGARVEARPATDHPHGAALSEARAAGVAVADAPAPSPVGAAADLIIDGLTGIGASGPLRPRAAALIAPLIAAGAPGERAFRVLAVDVPSGVGVDDGSLPGPVLAADRTVTFTCPRGAHLLPPAAPLSGRVDVVDLGLPVPTGSEPLASVPDPALLAALLRAPGATDHKYTRGVVGLHAGSEAYPGAAVLAVSGAIRAGVGMARIQAPRRAVDLVLASRPEAVPAIGRCQAIVVGPGTYPADQPRAEELRGALRAALRRGSGEGQWAVIDAGALPLLPDLLGEGLICGPEHVLTPHAGEAAALLSGLGLPATREEVEAAPASAARGLAGATGATVILKAVPALIASPGGGPVLSLDAGPGWLATAGSGDVLAGALGAVLAAVRADRERAEGHQRGELSIGAAGLLLEDAVALAAAASVRLHADAGRLASGQALGWGHEGRPIAALDVADHLPCARQRLRAQALPHDQPASLAETGRN
ncbi:bifunctional ADP-dependent NAD(P)H-hydrate dehydratase/NAD(P)H-hydrate epimerase [Actinomyces gaoshouyii]|uniref:bifunctional ADP-dependent NAD(P)H-hydrate dehydratase/NAD(P)H-hydrate epimerase n=1 Tax=Actinomyces gaoshouyii TaxID=1960083 RepID=UPI0009BE3F5E|nr:bifunctional ADP-dependent NAD(P)H-hydrate dehydratase/NAD(P)H-hydrate epimerase [Actinomyces gaoshouyii]ARD42796.1 bifunctional ADP-dependent (S)-NAD(P)H-hydrate dehydratase/NAD(P)H-hydrate epimerase [Actinomyces gaoshouyii]